MWVQELGLSMVFDLDLLAPPLRRDLTLYWRRGRRRTASWNSRRRWRDFSRTQAAWTLPPAPNGAHAAEWPS